MTHDAPSPTIQAHQGADRLARSKAQLRGTMLAAREDMAPAEQQRQNRLRTDVAVSALAARSVGTVACYLSREPEPATGDLVERLHQQGVRVLVPLLGRRPDGTGRHYPDWAWYQGADHLRAGLWGIPEPDAEGIGPDALSRAEVVLCSALAVDEAGRRLGVGGGWFDRALGHASIDADRWVLVYDHEILDRVPAGPLDMRVDAVLTSTGLQHTRPE